VVSNGSISSIAAAALQAYFGLQCHGNGGGEPSGANMFWNVLEYLVKL